MTWESWLISLKDLTHNSMGTSSGFILIMKISTSGSSCLACQAAAGIRQDLAYFLSPNKVVHLQTIRIEFGATMSDYISRFLGLCLVLSSSISFPFCVKKAHYFLHIFLLCCYNEFLAIPSGGWLTLLHLKWSKLEFVSLWRSVAVHMNRKEGSEW